jgi:sporulation protein YlmC with PRC-barrel domain
MLRQSLTAAALAVALATPAFAQQPNNASSSASTTSAQPATTGKFIDKQQASDWRGSKLIGTTVYGTDNASIGEVSDVVIGNDGAVKAAVIGVGGFLGVGEKNVAIPFDQLKITAKPDSSSIQKITLGYTKDELKNAPTFAYADQAASTTTGSGSNSGLNSLQGGGSSNGRSSNSSGGTSK